METITVKGTTIPVERHAQGKTFQVNDKKIETDVEGFMVDRDRWDQQVAEALAVLEGIALTDDHWQVINFLRDYYAEYLISPNVKVMLKHMRLRMGEENVDQKRLYELFPKGPALQGTKIGGLPKPRSCLDG
jgi:tRNA 2-thiouridine synthesizing protein E